MKKIVFCLVVLAAIAGIVYSQNAEENKWDGTVRFKPYATAAGISMGILEFAIDWVPYLTKNMGIPVCFDIAYGGGISAFGLMTGIEVVPSRKEKNGLYMCALAGPIFLLGDVIFSYKTDIGYQMVKNNGFVFTPAIGIKGPGLTGMSFDLMLDIGFAYKRNR